MMGDLCDICGYVGQVYGTAQLISVTGVILNDVCARRCLDTSTVCVQCSVSVGQLVHE